MRVVLKIFQKQKTTKNERTSGSGQILNNLILNKSISNKHFIILGKIVKNICDAYQEIISKVEKHKSELGLTTDFRIELDGMKIRINSCRK